MKQKHAVLALQRLKHWQTQNMHPLQSKQIAIRKALSFPMKSFSGFVEHQRSLNVVAISNSKMQLFLLQLKSVMAFHPARSLQSGAWKLPLAPILANSTRFRLSPLSLMIAAARSEERR